MGLSYKWLEWQKIIGSKITTQYGGVWWLIKGFIDWFLCVLVFYLSYIYIKTVYQLELLLLIISNKTCISIKVAQAIFIAWAKS